MRTLCFLLLTVSACASHTPAPCGAQHADGFVAQGDNDGDMGCGTSIDSLCNATTCEIMGEQYPATLSGWCAKDNADALDGVPSSRAGQSACGDWTLVMWPIADQSLAFYYDTSWRVVAIIRWSSAPPCEGACKPVCVAGPAGLEMSELAECVADSSLVCGA